MVSLKEELAAVLEKAVGKGLVKQDILTIIEVPPQSELGDFAFPCFKLSPAMKKAPVEIAKQLSEQIKLPASFEKVVATGPYLNFFVKKSSVAKQTLSAVLKQKEKFGHSNSGKGKKVMVEYSAPNTNKPLHVGHLRNDSIGMAVSNLLDATGHKVIKANLVNDRGIHICKSMLAYEKWGKGKKPNKKSDHFVGDYYVLFNKHVKENPSLEEEARFLLKKWENKDKAVHALWKKMNKWAIDGFKTTYKEFGSHFDIWFKESEFYNQAKTLIKDGLESEIFYENDDGAIVAKLEHHKLPNKIVQRADGTSIYITNDLALTKHKFEKFKLSESIWVVGSEQNLYFKQLFKIFDLLGFKWASQCKHLSYGMVYLPQGRMKSREGTVIDADDLMESVGALAAKEIKKRYPALSKAEQTKRAKAIALAAIKFFMLRIDEAKDLHFNPEESLSFEGETGPYLQYTYARAKSILRKAGKKQVKPDYKLLTENIEKKLVLLIYNFPGVVEKAANTLEPHLLSQHLLETAAAFNSFYHALQVINADSKELVATRLALVEATSWVLKNGLNLLNIQAIEKM
ncbi:arginine--tRNA ligase [bacterium]|nr:arginine--tRNA ligase [bacterium]